MPIRDDSLIARYIREIENPDSIGYKDGRWYEPDKQGYDNNNRGFGVDVIHNKGAKETVKNRNNKWLSEEEERFLRNSHIAESQRILDSKASPYILRTPPSEEKQAMAVGMLYRGDSVMQNPTVREAYLSGTDGDMQKAVSDYYQSKKVSERAQRHNNFFNPQKKNTSIPNSIRRPTPYSRPKFDDMKFTPVKKYDDGGYLNNDWDSLSYRDKAEMMKVAINNGITTLPEIKKAYNEFAKGGKMNNSQRAMNYLMSKGMSRTGASAIVGTLQAESNLDPTIHAQMKGDNGEGLAQWTSSRKKNFWRTLERIEPGAQRRYKNIVNVPLERQLDVVMAERPDVTRAIHNAKDVSTATDIMLRGYENGSGTVDTMASKKQMDNIYGKWNNGYNRQMLRRLSNANNLLGTHIDSSQFLIPQDTFDTIDSQINEIEIPQMQMPNGINVDPSTLYKTPTIDDNLFTNPKSTVEEVTYSPKEDRLEGIKRFNTIMGMMGRNTPFSIIGGSSEPGIMQYANAIYS